MKNGNAGRRSRIRFLILAGTFMIAAAAVFVPVYSVHSSSLPAGSPKPGVPVGASAKARQLDLFKTHSNSTIRAPWSPLAESIEIFAADCATPKTDFALGETICAKTDGVDLTVPGNYYLNWFHPDSTETNGGTITQNPQYFLYSLPTSSSEAGTWKVNIGRVTPAESSIIGNPPLFTVGESSAMATFAYDTGLNTCTNTPKTNFVLGETVCARATRLVGFRFAWVDAAGYIEKRTDITTDPQTDTFTLPATQTSVIDGITVDNRGQWRANAITSRGSVRTGAFFIVNDPANPVVDLSITKSLLGDNVQAGGVVQYEVIVKNNGPDDAANARFQDNTFSGATYNSVTQTEGPAFICSGSGVADCTIAVFPKGSQAKFLVSFTAGAAGSDLQNTASVSSDTTEQNSLDNSFTTASVKVGSGTPPPACLLECPQNINANADTEEGGQRGTHVNYAPPTTSGTCGTVTSSPASGSFFPVGTTTVTATSSEGDGSCSFTVTVVDEGNPPTITCPADKVANADSECEATINLGNPTTSGGQNVTITVTRSDGKPMYDCDVNGENCVRKTTDLPFSAGTTTVTWTATSHDDQGNTTGNASCTQTVTVNDVTPPTITAQDSTVAADANCQAAVPDYSNSVTDNCSCASNDNSQDCVGQHQITTTQDVPAGTMLGPGSYTIHLTANDGSSNNNGDGNTTTKTITFTVADQTPPTITCPANITTNTLPGTCSATVITGTATATDNCDSTPTIVGTRSDNQPLIALYPKGTTTITWRATDDAGNYSECTQTVTVVDNEPPTITFNGQTPSMWPPNHSYHTFTAADFISSVSDNCDTLQVSDVEIVSATSDEVENADGDGNTVNDIVIAADCKSIQLRAERQNNGDGRVYTITFRLRDTSGNTTTGTAKVYAPKNEGETPGDSGPHYTVTGSCP